MIDSQRIVSDAQLLAAWDASGIKRHGIPDRTFADALRPVVEFAMAAYVEDDRLELMEKLKKALDHAVPSTDAATFYCSLPWSTLSPLSLNDVDAAVRRMARECTEVLYRQIQKHYGLEEARIP
jgi:hypothetical protein